MQKSNTLLGEFAKSAEELHSYWGDLGLLILRTPWDWMLNDANISPQVKCCGSAGPLSLVWVVLSFFLRRELRFIIMISISLGVFGRSNWSGLSELISRLKEDQNQDGMDTI